MSDYINDLFWFRQLPHTGDNVNKALLLSDFLHFLKNDEFTSSLVDLIEPFTNWADVQCQFKEEDDLKPQLGLNSFHAQNILSQSNQLLPLYLKNCNACLIFRMNEHNSVLVSAFTVHPTNNDIMSVCSDLLVAYPEITVQVNDKNSILTTVEFVTMLHDLFFNQISQIRLKSNKSGEVVEDRDVVSSRIVTEWLMAVLGGVDGSMIVDTVQKKIRNSIEWNNDLLPYRRSGLWVSIKTVLQLLLFWKHGEAEGKISYKVILLRYLVHVAEKFSCEMTDEMKLQVISKLAVRLDKLQTLINSQNDKISSVCEKSVFTKVLEFVKEKRQELDKNWNLIHNEQRSLISVSLNSASNKARNICQTLNNSKEKIDHYLQIDQSQTVIKQNIPSSIVRSFDISSFEAIVHTDGGETCISELFVIEEWVILIMMDDWHTCTADNLERLMVRYKAVAERVYSNDPIGFSRMILTCLNIIRKLMEFAKNKTPIFNEYKTGINTNAIFNYLLLTTRDQFKLAFELENYFLDFDKSAIYGPDFLSDIGENSLSVRYAKNNDGMQQLKSTIEAEIETSISDKRPPYEKILPEKEDEKNAVVFELLIPDELRCVRNALIEFAELTNSYDVHQMANNYSESWKEYLSRHNSNKLNNRVRLTSSVKSFMRSHYSSQEIYHPRNPESNFIKENALNLKWAIDGKYVKFQVPKIVKKCHFTLVQGKYTNLGEYLKNYDHNQNMILSKQSECHAKLSLSEFLEFGSFRAGYRLQMHNLTKVLSNNLLSFDQEEVCVLLLQSLLQSCPSDDSWWRGTNQPLRDDNFSLELISLLNNLLHKVENNWKSIYQLTIIVFSAKKILELAENDKVSELCESLLFHVRDTALEWLSKTNDILSTSFLDNPVENSKIRNLQIDIACCCCLTFHGKSNLLRDFSKWLMARSIIYENLLLNSVGHGSLPQFRMNLLRETIRTSQTIQDSLYTSLNGEEEGALTDFLKEKWCEARTRQLNLKWKQYPNSENWYHTQTESPTCIIQVNVVDGALLINNAPVGRLPVSVTSTPEFVRTFKNMILDVRPGLEYNSFITKNSFGGRFFKFKLISNNEHNKSSLIISQLTSEHLNELIYFPHTNFNSDLPFHLIENHSHWIDKQSQCLLFCPTFFLDPNFSKVFYELNFSTRLLSQETRVGVYFIDNKSNLFREILKIIGRIEDAPFVHAYYEDETILVDLPRKGLTFELGNDFSYFMCKQFGMRVEIDFQVGTLIGLKKGLKLMNTDSGKTILIIPNGCISSKIERNHVSVDIDLKTNLSPPYFTYSINRQLNRVEAENSLSSWLYLAYLHGCTSYILPDPFTGMCGYESALQILQSKRCYQLHVPMNALEVLLLGLISALSPKRNYYPKHLNNMQQTLWNEQFKSLVQLDSYKIVCERIQHDNSQLLSALAPITNSKVKPNLTLYWKAYFKDANYYSQNCKIPQDSNYCSHSKPYNWNHSSSVEIETCIHLCSSLEKKKIPQFKCNLLSTLSKQTNSVDLTSIECWPSIDETNFSALTSKILTFTEKKLLLFLSFLAFFGMDKNLIWFLGFVYLEKQAIPEYPQCERMRNVKSLQVSCHEIESIFKSRKKSFIMLPHEETLNEYKKRMKIEISTCTDSLVNFYEQFKTSDSDTIPYHLLRMCSEFCENYEIEIEELFMERKENFKLFSYLYRLDCLKNSLLTHLELPKLGRFQYSNIHSSMEKPKWRISIDYSDPLQSLCQSSIIEKATNIFEKGHVENQDEIDSQIKFIESAIKFVLIPRDQTTNHLLFMAGLWFRITTTNVLKMLLDDSIDPRLRNLIGCYGVLITISQRLQRLKLLSKETKMTTLYNRESENKGHENWKPSQYPHWLLLEIEMNMSIRPIQIKVANHMINSQHNITTQLNMGEGKTSVIIPMLILELGKGNRLVRLTVLKTLLSTNYQSLRFKLGGMLDRPVIVTPFNRDVQVTNCELLLNLYTNCMKAGGVFLTVPEYRLSFELKSIESIKYCNLDMNRAKNLYNIQQWLEQHSRDILDESDEILHVRNQVIYTIGSQLDIDGGHLRWYVLQKVFRTIKKLANDTFEKYGPTCVEYLQEQYEHSFPHFRILEEDAFEYLVNGIVEEILDGKVQGIFISVKPKNRYLIKQFLTREEINNLTLKDVKDNCPPYQMETLLILRGLFAFGTLKLVLSRRWRVNYGVGERRSIAVPFRAKDVASERAEYGHPDISILLTLLSYYYSGLDNSQLEFAFEELMTSDDREKEYSKWVEESQNQIPERLKSLSNINLTDYDQKINQLFPFFKKSMSIIDYYLHKCVFPKECKQFPKKLTSSSWNLCNGKKHVTTGFSGTKSFLLPVSIQSSELEELLDTSEQVERNILNNYEYHVILNGESCKDTLFSMVHCSPLLQVLLDVGALMLEFTNSQLAKHWLQISSNEIEAAIYFNENDELTVIDRFNHVTNFDLSPYKNKLDKCVTYIDDIHTRGTDLKFPEGTRAAVTLGNGLSNERFVQACMRMRQLCSINGHSVSFWASKEVDSNIRKINKTNHVKPIDIVNWTHYNSNQIEQDYLLQWSIQGLIFSHKLWLHEELAQKGYELFVREFYEKYVEDEILSLEFFYGLERKKQLLLHIFKLMEQHFRSLHKNRIECRIFERNIGKIVEKLAQDKTEIFTQALNEEQERELENELEEERQVFRPPSLSPIVPTVDEQLRLLVLGIPTQFDSLKSVKNLFIGTELANLPNIWNGNIYATESMRKVVISNDNSRLDYYQRPIDWFVCSSTYNILILICPFEANSLFELIRENGKLNSVQLHRFGRRLHKGDELLFDNASLCIPSHPIQQVHNLQMFLPDLYLLSCSLYFKNVGEMERVCDFLSIAPKPYNVMEEEALDRGDIDENGLVVHNSMYYQRLVYRRLFSFNPTHVVEKLMSVYDRDKLYQDSHLFMVIRHLHKPFY